MENVYRVYLQNLYEKYGAIHPQTFIKNQGYKVIKFEGAPIADCVFMQLDKQYIGIDTDLLEPVKYKIA